MSVLSARQPFGLVTESKLRNLTNIKNKQNAIIPTPSKSLKRSYDADASSSDNDNENVDPIVFLSPSKKNKGLDGLYKPQNFVLKPSLSTSNLKTRPIATPQRLSLATKTTPISAPVGGRSPTKKRAGILSRRRVAASPFTRVDPPSFARTGGNGMPFSLDAALSGTVRGCIPKETSASETKDGMPRKWFFEIHEDTAEEELGNLMQHSTSTLDISDDESKTLEKDARGKENIPPADFAGIAPVARKDMMFDEVRTPLGDLNAADYYGADCDANSVFIIPEDREIDFAFGASGKESTDGQKLLKEVLSKACSTISTPTEVKEIPTEAADKEEPFVILDTESIKTESVKIDATVSVPSLV